MTFLRDDPECRFISFIDVCGVDYPTAERFDVVYHLRQRRTPSACASRPTRKRPCPRLPGFSRRGLVRARSYDLYGILFSGHHDLRRILTDYGFDGHPLRKDFHSPACRGPRRGTQARLRAGKPPRNSAISLFVPGKAPIMRPVTKGELMTEHDVRTFNINFGPSTRRRTACCVWCWN